MGNHSWPLVSLGEHVDLLTGFPFKSKSFTSDPEDMPLVKGENVQQRYIDWEAAKKWPRDDVKEYERYRLKPGDVVLAMDRPWVEAGLKYAWIKRHDPQCLLVQRVARLRGDESLLTDYLRYVIASPSFTAYIRPIVTGVNVPHISPQQIKDFRLRLPPVEIQEKAVAMLSPFDDFIENGRRRVRVLEEIARTIFTEWFVKFGYPGHEKERLNDSETELGKIPEGWEIAEIGDIAKVVLGGTPSRNKPEYWGGDVPWIKSGKLNDIRVIEGTEYIANEGLVNSATKMMPKRTVLIAITGAILVSVSEIELCANQSVVGIHSSERVCQEYIYEWVKSSVQQLISKMSGSAQQHVNKEIIESTPILVPSRQVMKRFEGIAKPIFDEIANLLFRNKTLEGVRDLLLPRLISGNLDVSNFDVKVEDGNE